MDDCASGAKECAGSGYRLCGNYDSDSCLDWSSVTNCTSEETCTDGDCTVVPTVNSSGYSASGLVAISSGTGISEVSLELYEESSVPFTTGARESSASFTTRANGNYIFAGLPKGSYTITPNKNNYRFTPTDISFAITNSNLTGLDYLGSAFNYESIKLLSDYMTAMHSQEINNFESDDGILRNSFGINLYSSAYLNASKKDYLNHIQNFVDDSIAYIQKDAQTMLIDKDAVMQLLTDYQNKDYSYAVSYYSNGGSSFLNQIKIDLENIYSAAKVQVEIL